MSKSAEEQVKEIIPHAIAQVSMMYWKPAWKIYAPNDFIAIGIGDTEKNAWLDALDNLNYKKPPCQECGALTEKEANDKCICSGDKDDCHGCYIWAD